MNDKIVIKGKRREDIFATIGEIAIELSPEELVEQLDNQELKTLYRIIVKNICGITQEAINKILPPLPKIEELKILYSTEPLEQLNKEFAIVGKINELIKSHNEQIGEGK